MATVKPYPAFVYVYTETSEDYYLFRKQPSAVFVSLAEAKKRAVPDRRRDWTADPTDARRWLIRNRRGEEEGEIVRISVTYPEKFEPEGE